jgi:hypothetical protein
VKRILLEIIGWSLMVAGVAALVLPGPGLLMLFGGMLVLSRQYEWAERRLAPVERKALQAAAEGVRTWPRIVASVVGALWLIGLGIVWFIAPPAPGWWPVDERWWLAGGPATASTLVASGILAFALLAYSYRRFRPLVRSGASTEEALQATSSERDRDR